MRKTVSVLLILCMIPGLFVACSSPAGQLNSQLRRLSGFSSYAFTAVGSVTFEGEVPPFHVPTYFTMEGSSGAGQFSAALQYRDADEQHLYDMSLLENNGTVYISFVSLFQYVMDQEYADHGAASVSDVFSGNPYLIHPNLDISALLPDIPALVNDLSSRTLREGLSLNQGMFTLMIPGNLLEADLLSAIAGPFGLFTDMRALSFPTALSAGPDFILETLLGGDTETYTLEFVFTRDTASDTFTAWLTLTAPELMTITLDITYRATDAHPLAPPSHTIDMAQLRETVLDYRAAQSRTVFLAESGLEIIHDLPELHMVGHHLERAHLLESYEMDVDGTLFQVSVMANAVNTSTGDAVFSWSPSLSIVYQTLGAYSASETMAPFVLEDLNTADHDGENFRRTSMRVNAQDTAAVKALYFDDNHMGRTVHIYVLQNLEDTDKALFLGIVIILDDLTHHSRLVLDQLGFQIGLNFQEYLNIAALAD